MHGIRRWRVRLVNRACQSLPGSLAFSACRHCATVPTEDDKRYGDLAKEHHPDVSNSSAASSTNRMTDINNAYNTWGIRLLASSYYSKQDSAYQPWYEDMDPLMYELMWEEMRRQNEEDGFVRNMHVEAFYRANDRWRPPRGNASARPRQSSGSCDGRQSHAGKKSSSSTTWPEEQVKAMVNMYQDGKSFEFIANALGKESAAAVLEEFNRWSSDNQPQRRKGAKPHHAKRHRYHGGHGPFYHAESPDEVPFELYEMMEEEPYFDGSSEENGDPFGYYPGDEEAYDMPYAHATPFYGVHQMSGGPAPHGHFEGGVGRVHNSSRKIVGNRNAMILSSWWGPHIFLRSAFSGDGLRVVLTLYLVVLIGIRVPISRLLDVDDDHLLAKLIYPCMRFCDCTTVTAQPVQMLMSLTLTKVNTPIGPCRCTCLLAACNDHADDGQQHSHRRLLDIRISCAFSAEEHEKFVAAMGTTLSKTPRKAILYFSWMISAYQVLNGALNQLRKSIGAAECMLTVLEVKTDLAPTKGSETATAGVDSVTAIVGGSGGGKSTTMLCMYEPQVMCVLVDGRDIRDLLFKWLHHQCAVVAQDMHHGLEKASHEAAVTAAKAVNAHSFIVGLSDGYSTFVGE
ncbi:DnaJ domain family protein [Leishmania donovani]|uniref:DnaJ domain family protein n=1 Tax=Leishmania donovani TaxID=5661 RepID=A0A504X1K5_LEIDO|nr:DnaJ domain family protein [Leishmania donovani]